MISQCPQCHSRLTDFAVACERCGWNIINSAAATPQTARAPGSNATNGSRKPESSENPPVIIVKNVAKTSPPPPPEDKSTEDIPPPLEDTSKRSKASEMPPLEIDLQIQKAMEFIERENYTSALSYLNRAIIDVPPERLAECFSLRGYVHLKNLDFVRAENDCTQAINQNWEEAQTYAWRAASRGEQNKWHKAFDDLERACELAGNQRDQYLSLMDSYSETASEYFREQIRAGNETANLFFERGWIYFRSGKYQKAERDFNHALAVEPSHPWSSVGLAKLLFQHQDLTLGAPETKQLASIKNLCNAGTHGDPACERAALEMRAQINFKEGRISSAHRDLDRLIELAGDDPKRLVECCRLRSELGDHVKAIDGLTEVLESNAEHHLASLVRGDCYRVIKNYALAIADYSRYLRFYPEDVKALIRRANLYLVTQRLDKAHADLDEAMATDQTNFDAYLIRSKLFLKQNKLDLALSECEKAVRLDNQKPEVFAVLAEIYQRLCDYGRAIEEYSRSIELAQSDEEKAQYLYHRGAAYYELENFEKGLKDFNKSCKLRPNHSGSWIWKAATCSRMEKWSDAIVGLQQAIAVRPSASGQYQKLGKPVAERAIVFFDQQQQRGHTEIDIFRQRGLAYQFLGKDSEAIKDYTKVLNEQAEDTETLIRRGQVYARLGQHAAAEQDFSRVIRNEPTNHLARYCRSICRTAEGKIEEARSDLVKAIKIAPQHPRYHIQLADLMQKTGDQQKVIEALDNAILRDPSDPLTYRRRGIAHVQSQNYMQAISDFTHSLELYPAQMEVLTQRGFAYLKSEQSSLAIEDFELALTHNDRLAKAYSGRAAALVLQGRFEYALIWLTKAIHRFQSPRELAEILFARGKVFYQMRRLAPAVSDFSNVIDLMRSDPKTVAAARYARAVANVHAEKWEKAQKDFRRLSKIRPQDQAIQAALAWLDNRKSQRPEFLSEEKKFHRPTRPSVRRRGVKLVESESKWNTDAVHNTWVVRTEDKKEYGPVHFDILKTWILDGRIDGGMKLLRADWSKWKRAEKIFSEISPVGSQSDLVDDFPGINVGRTSQASSNEEA